jgi:hypothetical protein
MRMLILALSASSFLATAALAQTETAPPAAEAKPAAASEVICVEQDPNASSRLQHRRTCHTQEEWDKLRSAKR